MRVSEGELLEGGESDKSQRGSLSHSDPESGFVHIDGDVGGSGYNETKVDIVAVPCPGADPVQPWLGDDPFPDDYFGAPLRNELQRHPTIAELAGDAILSPAINRHLPMASQVWVRQGIRKSVSTARVLLYKHRALSEGDDLASLAHDLLGHVRDLRERLVSMLLPSLAISVSHIVSIPRGHCSSLPTVLAAWLSSRLLSRPAGSRNTDRFCTTATA